jgi:menaquinone-dependent protoporphyrinogen oxidase
MAAVLRQQGVEATVVNARKERIEDIAGYDLVIIGSGIMINRWTRGPEKFLKRFQEELTEKKVALFVCCGSASDAQRGQDGRPSPAEEARRRYLVERAAVHELQPIALGLFGGVYDFNKVPWYAKKAMEMDRPRIEVAFEQTAPGVYDTRDWDAIRAWARDVADKA